MANDTCNSEQFKSLDLVDRTEERSELLNEIWNTGTERKWSPMGICASNTAEQYLPELELADTDSVPGDTNAASGGPGSVPERTSSEDRSRPASNPREGSTPPAWVERNGRYDAPDNAAGNAPGGLRRPPTTAEMTDRSVSSTAEAMERREPRVYVQERRPQNDPRTTRDNSSSSPSPPHGVTNISVWDLIYRPNSNITSSDGRPIERQ